MAPLKFGHQTRVTNVLWNKETPLLKNTAFIFIEFPQF